MSQVIEINDSQFQSEVIKDQDKPVLAYFWASWCGPCRLVSPSINSLAEFYGDRLKIVKLEVDQSPESVKLCKVEGVPALRLFKGEEIITSSEGAITKQKIQTLLEPHI